MCFGEEFYKPFYHCKALLAFGYLLKSCQINMDIILKWLVQIEVTKKTLLQFKKPSKLHELVDKIT